MISSPLRTPLARALLTVALLSAVTTAAGTADAGAAPGPGATTAARSASRTVSPDAAPSSCPQGDFCAYQGVNYTGKEQKMGPCRVYELEGTGWSGAGSWYNNQSDGIKALMGNKYGVTIFVTPPAPSHDTNGDWTPVWYIQNC
ncbi:Peptidase inhibitor family I36 [Actinacidiphila yanglinensis]|uniref:Peptidase inhibitor family I36 n=1 Tax=Actinacidiphila yanglinensis TaxID=310779 RepID=A0A1H6E2K6_9ACTN|nr:peptidase inhibitor family I36 protein [Actinacidiphila yanglinensis]SEG91135.1 Peptidase inhibitor family I36 [Actinacidiphila yanglinensis]